MTETKLDQLVNLRLLLSVEGIGPGKIRNLISKFNSLEEIFNAGTMQLCNVEGINKSLSDRIVKSSSNRKDQKEQLLNEIDTLQKMDAKVITLWDEEFPQLLKKIYDPPLIIYTLGSFSELDDFSVAVVGTRVPTNYGRMQAERITVSLAKKGVTIVSGLARGIDSIAHRAALVNNGRTISVIGSGLNVIYPPENKKLFDEIAEKGLIISEFPLNSKPDAQNFPKRNRIIAGLSLGTVVIESAVTGGAMQTANLALEMNREVFAVPGNLGVHQSEGTNKLIQRGEAKLIKDADDIIIELETPLKPLLNKKQANCKPENITLFEESILNAIGNQPEHIDKIALSSGMSVSESLVHLLTLEFKGYIKQLPGKLFAKI